MTTVVNLRTDDYDVYIGRGSKWGNPYSHKSGTLALYTVKSRSQSIALYEKYILDNVQLLSDIKELRDKQLGCFCKKSGHNITCHGDILARLANLVTEDYYDIDLLIVEYTKRYLTQHTASNLF